MVHRWFRQPAFRAALKRAQDVAYANGIARIKHNVTKAVDVLLDFLESEDSQIRIRAGHNGMFIFIEGVSQERRRRQILPRPERVARSRQGAVKN
jgi:hypothetical protein